MSNRTPADRLPAVNPYAPGQGPGSPSPPKARFSSLQEIEARICDLTAEQLGLVRKNVQPHSRLIEDLDLDSLDLVELMMEIEEAFCVTLPDKPSDNVYKSVFTRRPFRLRDLAELVYLQQGSGPADRASWTGRRKPLPRANPVPFTQLSDRLDPSRINQRFHEPLGWGTNGALMYRRQTDGMRCALIPAASVQIGSDSASASPDEQPLHRVAIDSFLIDAEPVSTTAYARFLNSVHPLEEATLLDWFVLNPGDRRAEHALLVNDNDCWHPLPGTQRFPMMLVSWYGANAYSLWANGCDWRCYRADAAGKPAHQASFLPSEAQWEYAARGPYLRLYPWGDQRPEPALLRSERHRVKAAYTPATLPMADVNEQLGMSPFGLHHMAGNVWQWCRDWYDPLFYSSDEASRPNPENRCPTGVRSERGGSWVGPAIITQASYRRGRPPLARGRCLGFRCIGDLNGK